MGGRALWLIEMYMKNLNNLSFQGNQSERKNAKWDLRKK